MTMKRLLSIILSGCMVLGTFTACMDDIDEPNTDDYLVTSPTSLGETNITIKELKQRYSSQMTQTNAFSYVEEDLIFEGVVAANDEGGNLYQTLLLRDGDDAIVLAVKNTCLYPYFMLGQRVKVNANGLYIGVYSKLPKLGQPYYTSSGNLRLGAMLFQLCSTNVELLGEPDPTVPECTPIFRDVAWLRASANKNYENYPQLVTIEGYLTEADGEAIFAPEELQDAGYGVDRPLKVGDTQTTTVTVRTSTQNDVAFVVMPTQKVRLTGLLSIYDSWQIQLRSIHDIEIVEE